MSHDSGGAELLSSYVRRNKLPSVFALAGPALNVFARKFGTVENLSIEDALVRAASLLCSTSWQSDLELHAIAAARAAGKRSVAFLDHWVNYRERFERGSTRVLPDEIWVGDEMALAIARAVFSTTPVSYVPNPYFEDVKVELDAAARSLPRRSAAGGVRVLFVSEPLSEHARVAFGDERHWGYTEMDALTFLLDRLDLLADDAVRVVIRPHPAERPGKFDAVRMSDDRVTLGGAATLAVEVASSDIIAGCHSMAMVVGLLGGKRVINCIPGGHPCRLPHPQIESLHALARTALGKDRP